jgi:type I restriction enzyme, S subunit
MSWINQKLSAVATILMGQSPEGNSYNTNGIGLPLLNGAADYKGSRFSPKKYTNNPTKIAIKGDILLGVRATIGNLSISDGEYCIGRGLAAIRVNEKNVDRGFIMHFLSEQIAKLSSEASGSTIKGIVKEDLFDMQIPLPPLATQKRIAEILDAADAFRLKDQELLKKYDELAQAIFIDMFGDPVKNQKGWDVKNLDEVCLKITDGTHDTPERLTEGVKFITGKHIRPYFIDYQNSDYVTAEIHAEIYRRCNPEFGDVLYTNIGVNYATAAMNTVNYEFSMKNVALLKYNRELLTGRFLEYQLNNDYFKDRLKTITGIGGAQQFLSLAQIKSIKLLVPSLSLQLIFEEKINTLFTSVFKQKDSISLSNYLFDSLIQKAFKGELVT